MRTRRRLVGVVVAGLLLGIVPPGVPATSPAQAAPPKSLRMLALERGISIGTMVATAGDYRAEEATGRTMQTVCSEFNLITPGNALKFGIVHPSPKRYDWVTANRVLAKAAGCGMQVIGHTLVWHLHLPAWLLRLDGRPAAVRRVLKDHITRVVGRFAGRISAWDVVNEAVLPDGRLRDSFWLRNLGPRYVLDAFRWARQADPTATLYYNDYGNEGVGDKTNAVHGWLRTWLGQGAEIDGAGLQVHRRLRGATWFAMAHTMRRYARLGLVTRVSEMDVALDLPADDGRLANQAVVFYDAMRACLSPGTRCETFTVWGVSDRYWTEGGAKRCCGLLFSREFKKKPAYFGLVAALRQAA
ncbi:MAG: endo-1,4-beta-xylanase [Actinomycetota bacterium]